MDTNNLPLILMCALIAFMLYRQLAGKVAPARAKALVEAGAKLVDVRSPPEFARGHIQGAVNIPVGELSSRMAEVGERDRPVVVYCASGMRSANAASQLKGAGFREVHDLGAMARWG